MALVLQSTLNYLREVGFTFFSWIYLTLMGFANLFGSIEWANNICLWFGGVGFMIWGIETFRYIGRR